MQSEYRIPPYTVEMLFSTLTQTIPWNIGAKIPESWKEGAGEGAVVAVLDSGISDHPDLAGAVIDSANFTNSPTESDRVGHGTHVAGIIAARNNEIGVVGVAPQASLLNVKVLGDDGAGRGTSIAQGIKWAVAKKANVINLSLGSPTENPAISAAIREAVDAGVFVVCAAGNDGRVDSVNWPARMPEVIAVSAIDRNGAIANFSSRGPQVDIAAPGQDITSTYLNGYAKLSGTSMSSPWISGICALLVSQKLRGRFDYVTNNRSLLAHLRASAVDMGAPGHDSDYGWGVVDPTRFLTHTPGKPDNSTDSAGIWVWIPGGKTK